MHHGFTQGFLPIVIVILLSVSPALGAGIAGRAWSPARDGTLYDRAVIFLCLVPTFSVTLTSSSFWRG